jgi:hypothetical protein
VSMQGYPNPSQPNLTWHTAVRVYAGLHAVFNISGQILPVYMQ